jgi:hypothetical protein
MGPYNRLHFMIKKVCIFLKIVKISNFGYQKPGSGSGLDPDLDPEKIITDPDPGTPDPK